jgi:hypothetical protein
MGPHHPERPAATEDGHHVVIGGRKWRATDPHIPAPFHRELVAELMDARRAVRGAGRVDDPSAERHARDRVRDAKIALGERGVPWWEAADDAARAARLEAVMRALLRHRKPESTICPSDAARVAGGPAWRDAMDAARKVAFELQARGVVDVRHAGRREASLDEVHGPLRIARGPRFPT